MGYWFGEFSDCTSWRKTPTKIGDTWYTPKGEKIKNPDAYFAAVERNGRYWEGDTGWKKSNRYCSSKYDHEDTYNDYDEENFEEDESIYEDFDYDPYCGDEDLQGDLDDYEYNQCIYNP